MKYDVTAVLIKHIKELYQILDNYNVCDKSSLASTAETDFTFQKAVLMSVGYIGELSEKLDDDTKQSNPNVDWHRLSSSRDIAFHDYDTADMEIIASVIFDDISALRLIREVDSRDLKQALDLVNEVFTEFVAADYSEQGQTTFRNYLKNKYDEVSADLISGHKKMWACYQCGKVAGVIATRDISHIALMFVDKRHHKTRIARQLFNVVLEQIKQNEGVTQITVNSSPYAVNVYERLGFEKTGGQQEKDGIIFTPMMRSV